MSARRRAVAVAYAAFAVSTSIALVALTFNIAGVAATVVVPTAAAAMALVTAMATWRITRSEERVTLALPSWAVSLFRIPARLKGFSANSLTNLAVLLAGRRRLSLRDEWRAHLAGEGGHDPATWRKIGQALGFVAAAIHLRLQDAADLAWRPVDAVLASRTWSNLFVGGPVIVTLFAIVHYDGRFGLVADDQDLGELGGILYGVIRTGRWWRGIKPPPPKPRRAQAADSDADQGRPSPELSHGAGLGGGPTSEPDRMSRRFRCMSLLPGRTRKP